MSMNVGDIVEQDGEYKIMTNNGLKTMTTILGATGVSGSITSGAGNNWNGSALTVAPVFDSREVLDRYALCEMIAEHKVQEQELLKLQEVDINYAQAIKDNLTKKVCEMITPRMAFTKIKDKDLDVHSFRGRIWVFTKDELDQLIKDVRNA